jgi:DNA-binding LacI/PurR family transcriptional regulator
VFSSNDQMALGLIHAFRAAGLDVPRDVSIVGFDDIPESAHFWPPLTTVRQDFRNLGVRCVTMLLDAIHRAGDPAAAPDTSISSQAIAGVLACSSSTRRRPRGRSRTNSVGMPPYVVPYMGEEDQRLPR